MNGLPAMLRQRRTLVLFCDLHWQYHSHLYLSRDGCGSIRLDVFLDFLLLYSLKSVLFFFSKVHPVENIKFT
jgi:hypothetical protein